MIENGNGASGALRHPACEHAVVIDDVPAEALPLITCFSRWGIPVLYVRGYESDAETTKAPTSAGVVFLDLQLFPGLNDSKSMASAAYGALETAMQGSRFPYLLFIWSKHTDEALEEFKEMLRNGNVAQPFSIVNAEKSDYFEDADGERRFIEGKEAELKSRIGQAIGDNASVLALWEWDRLSRQAVSQFTARITPATDWRDGLWEKKLLATLALAASKEPGSLDNERLAEGAFRTFSRAFQGQFQAALENIKPAVAEVAAEDACVVSAGNAYALAAVGESNAACFSNARGSKFFDRSGSKLSESDKAALQLRLAAERRIATLNSCLYMCPADHENGFSFAPGSLCTMREERERDWLAQLSEGAFGKRDYLSEGDVARYWLELTPQCDYAQKKCREYFFVQAAFVKKLSKNEKRSEFLYVTPLLMMGDQVGRFYIQYDSKRVVAHADSAGHEITSAGRLSELILSDIRFHFVRYMGRIGIPD